MYIFVQRGVTHGVVRSRLELPGSGITWDGFIAGVRLRLGIPEGAAFNVVDSDGFALGLPELRALGEGTLLTMKGAALVGLRGKVGELCICTGSKCSR